MKKIRFRCKRLRRAIFTEQIFISMVFVSLSFVCKSAIAETPITPARQNELLYFVKHDCGSCHGLTLKGGLGPALLPETLAAKPKDYLVTTILEGREDTAMPPWKPMLSRIEAEWITEQLQNGTVLPTALAKEQSSPKQLLRNQQ